MIKFLIVIKFVYKTIIRDLIVQAINNPDSDIDEFVIELLDRLFDYDG